MQTSTIRMQPVKLPVREDLNIEPIKPEQPSKPKIKSVEIPKSELNENKKISVEIIRSSYDALVRGVARFVEKFIDNKILRVLYRLGTESIRKVSEISLINYFGNKETNKQDYITALLRAFEHVPATSFIEPNLFESKLQRILAGFGNMAVRFATRFGFYKVNAINFEELGLKNSLDEFLSRAVLRAVYVDSTNPIVGIGVRVLEQLFINLNLHIVKPLSRLFPNFSNLFVKKTI